MGLAEYHKKRDFKRTTEPRGAVKPEPAPADGAGRFVVQQHAASHLHYDFRLELDGVLKSWAVPKGPSLDPGVRRLAIQVEDHPLEYGDFEGIIPTGEYGGGTVQVWDQGAWTCKGDARADYRAGRLKFELRGDKLQGGWMLVRVDKSTGQGGKSQWLLIKEHDDAARPGARQSVTELHRESALSGRTLEQIAADADRVWGPVGEQQIQAPTKPGKAARKASPKRAAARIAEAKTPRRTRPQVKAANQINSNENDPPPGKPTDGGQWAAAARALEGARPARQPEAIAPQLATLAAQPPAGDGWLHEMKYDGYRMLAFKQGGSIRLLSRNGKDWTTRVPALVEALQALPVPAAVFDGEMVVLHPDGRTDFQALQHAIKGNGMGREVTLAYYVFDLPWCAEHDLMAVPLIERKGLLARILGAAPAAVAPDSAVPLKATANRGKSPRDVLEPKARTEQRQLVRYSEHITGAGARVFSEACRLGMEGIISKQASTPYTQGRNARWLKSKCTQRQEFVIAGYTDPEGGRSAFGALLLGHYDADGKLIYVGRVGTGFTEASLRDLHRQMRPLEQSKPAFSNPPRGAMARGVHWLRAQLVGEVAFTEWTADHSLRHPSFQGLRLDKPAREVLLEKPRKSAPPPPAPPPAQIAATTPRAQAPAKPIRRGARAASSPTEVAGVRLTHPDRVLYPELGLTKLDLARYYEVVAPLILPHVAGRPLAIVRCPEDWQGPCFFQKHTRPGTPPPVRGVVLPADPADANDDADTEPSIVIDDLSGLVAMVQTGALELHPWGSTLRRLETPRGLVFDLDPGPGVVWQQVIDGARLLRARLEALGLVSFVKTSGGKGLHICVPLQTRAGSANWGQAKAFAHALARQLEREAPHAYIATMSKARRNGRIFIDYLRNGRGATAVAAYSPRARKGAPVSMPIAWSELTAELRPDAFHVPDVAGHLKRRKRDPWADFFTVRQSLGPALLRKVGVR